MFSGGLIAPPPGLALDLQGDVVWQGSGFTPSQTSLRVSSTSAPAFEASFAYSFNTGAFLPDFQAHGFVFLLSATPGGVGSSLYAPLHPSVLNPAP